MKEAASFLEGSQLNKGKGRGEGREEGKIRKPRGMKGVRGTGEKGKKGRVLSGLLPYSMGFLIIPSGSGRIQKNRNLEL